MLNTWWLKADSSMTEQYWEGTHLVIAYKRTDNMFSWYDGALYCHGGGGGGG